MRVSGYLFLLEQTLCSFCLMAALQRALSVSGGHWLRRLSVAASLSLLQLLIASWPLGLRALGLVGCAPMLLLGIWPTWPDRRTLWRCFPRCLLLVTLLWGTAALSLALPLPGSVQVLTACAALMVLSRMNRRSASLPGTATLIIRHGGNVLRLTALVDSGNLLCDPVSGDPVVVLPRQLLSQLHPPGSSGTRWLRVRTVSGTSLMTILRPDGISLLLDSRKLSGQKISRRETTVREIPVRALLGAVPEGYSGKQALIPSSLLCALPPPDSSIRPPNENHREKHCKKRRHPS